MMKPDSKFYVAADVSRLARMGWWDKTELEQGLKQVYCAYANEAA